MTNFINKIKDFVANIKQKVGAFMAQGHNLLITQITMVVISVFLNIWGLLSLLNVIDLFKMSAFDYFDNIALIARYVLIIINMAVGILLFGVFAGTLKGKHKTIWLIINCAYSTILTLPLLYTFLALFAAPSGTLLPMVDLIYEGAFGLIKPVGVQYFVFVLGSIMSIIFLAVPLLSCIDGVKKNIAAMKAESADNATENNNIDQQSNSDDRVSQSESTTNDTSDSDQPKQ